MHDTFAAFSLHPLLDQAIGELGFSSPTPIQARTIPLLLEGCDVMGQAQTGTGKTAAYGLPLLQRLDPGSRRVQALVLTPTRELAIQVGDALRAYGKGLGVRVSTIYGGHSYQEQLRDLRRGAPVVVGTPGRLLDLLRQGALDLDGLATLVLDEADEMLSMGFVEDIESILAHTPAGRQTVLFSATLSRRVRDLAGRYQRNPQAVSITPKQLTGSGISQRYYLVRQQEKVAALMRLFEIEPVDSALVFARTRLGTGELAGALGSRGIAAEALSGELSQDARMQVMHRFRQGQVRVLVATDVAARGLDIDDISHVFNYDLPDDPEVYVHRIGRTGRAGREGTAVSLLDPGDTWKLRRIESYTRHRLARAELPTVQEIENHRQIKLLEKMEVWIRRGRCIRERELVDLLVRNGHAIEDIAAAALKLARAEEKRRPIEPVTPIKEEQLARGRRPAGRRPDRRPPGRPATDDDMVTLVLDIGRSRGVAVNHVVSALAHYSGINGGALGKIRIGQEHTMVDVPGPLVAQVLARSGAYRIGRRPVAVRRA